MKIQRPLYFKRKPFIRLNQLICIIDLAVSNNYNQFRLKNTYQYLQKIM